MPRAIRIFLTLLSIAMFLGGSVLLGLTLSPILFLLSLGDRHKFRTRCTAAIAWGYGTFLLWMKLTGLIGYREKPQIPREVFDAAEGPVIVISNHPTWIDVLFYLNANPTLTCVVKQSWYDSLVFGLILRSTHYLPSGHRDGDALEAMCAHLSSGHSLLLFPEGTRSTFESLHRFRGGAYELSKRTGAPIVEFFLGVNRPMLMKGQAPWDVPEGRPIYRFRVIHTSWPAEGLDPRAERVASQDRYRAHFSHWQQVRAAHLDWSERLPALHAGSMRDSEP